MTKVLDTGRLRKHFETYPAVMAVYLFGSSVVGRGSRFSDVDVAVLFREGQCPDFGERLESAAELSRIMRRDVDLVYLNDSSCILRMQVIRKGVIILNREPGMVNQFVVNTLGEYFDLKFVRRPIEKKLSKVSILD